MIAQLNTTYQTEITSEIIESYTDFDGVQVDVVMMVYPDGTTETRQCWAEETLDEPVYCVKTSKGNVVKSSWQNTHNNKWVITYRQLFLQRAQNEAAFKAFLKRFEQEQEEIEMVRAAELAKADLGFGW